MNESFVKARTIFDRLTEESLARHSECNGPSPVFLSRLANIGALAVDEKQRPPFPQPQSTYPCAESQVHGQQLPGYGHSENSQTSGGEVRKAPPTGNIPPLTQRPLALQPGSPWRTSWGSRPTEQYMHSRSGAVVSQDQGIHPIPLSLNMRMSSAAQYNPGMDVPISVSSNSRVQAQHIDPAPVPIPINPVLTSQPVLGEEVSVECAVRDQAMADVDITSPGVWARTDDVHCEDLFRRELDEEAMGIPPQEQQRSRARGVRLTNANLKLLVCVS